MVTVGHQRTSGRRPTVTHQHGWGAPRGEEGACVKRQSCLFGSPAGWKEEPQAWLLCFLGSKPLLLPPSDPKSDSSWVLEDTPPRAPLKPTTACTCGGA